MQACGADVELRLSEITELATLTIKILVSFVQVVRLTRFRFRMMICRALIVSRLW